MPVRLLDLLARDSSEAGVGDKLVRAGEDADGVQLDGAEPAQHGGHATAARVGADEPLRGKGHNARFILAQGELRRRQGGTGHGRRLPAATDKWHMPDEGARWCPI